MVLLQILKFPIIILNQCKCQIIYFDNQFNANGQLNPLDFLQ